MVLLTLHALSRMADVKDILGVPRNAAVSVQSDASKPKERMQRPAGMSREAFALLDGSHPIPPSHLAGDLSKKSALLGLKQKRKLSNKGLTTYQFRPFTNPARKDGLQLKHWVKCFKDTAGKLKEAEAQYPIAKFNKQVCLVCLKCIWPQTLHGMVCMLVCRPCT